MYFQEEKNGYLIVVHVLERRGNGIIHGGEGVK